MNNGVVFLGMGFELLGVCIGGYYFGTYVDAYMGWEAKASVYLVILLMIGWFFHLFMLIKKFEQNDDSDSAGPKT